MKTLRFKLASDNADINGTEFNIVASELIGFTPAFNTANLDDPTSDEVVSAEATTVMFTHGQIRVQESCRTIRTMLRKLETEAADAE